MCRRTLKAGARHDRLTEEKTRSSFHVTLASEIGEAVPPVGVDEGVGGGGDGEGGSVADHHGGGDRQRVNLSTEHARRCHRRVRTQVTKLALVGYDISVDGVR